MFNILPDNTIELTRGDIAPFTVEILTDQGEAYHMQEGDTLTLSVKQRLSAQQYTLQKVVKGSADITIEPADTAGLAFGDYIYDVQLDTETSKPYTVVQLATFRILPEVTV